MKLEKREYAKFTAIAHSLIPVTDKEVTVASLDNLKSLIPEDTKNRDGLIPISANFFVANLSNHNGCVISGPDALKLIAKFKYRFITRNHNLEAMFGSITNFGYSKFHEDYLEGKGSELLTEEEVMKQISDPFNCAIAGLINAEIDEDFAQLVEMSADKDSPNFMSLSFSFECAFNEYHIASGSAKLSEAEIITDDKEIERLREYLTHFSGKGKDPKTNKSIYIKPVGELYAGNASIVKTPAALLKGITTASLTSQNSNVGVNVSSASNNSTISDSQVSNLSVKETRYMKLKNFEQIKSLTQDELKTEVTVADLRDVVEAKLTEVNEAYCKQVKEKAEAEKAAIEKAAQVEKDAQTLKEQFEALQKQFEASAAQVKLQEEKETARALEDTFQRRMASLDEKFDLDDKKRAAIAKQIKPMNDETFASWSTDFELFAAKKEAANTKTEAELAAEKKDAEEKATKDALEKAKASRDVPNTSTTGENKHANTFKLGDTVTLVK